jgi:hypothetical protein
MYSDRDKPCSHGLGFPIRKSPDRRLLASPRGLSQLTASFFACLRQGIHTHALSNLTIKSTADTKCTDVRSLPLPRDLPGITGGALLVVVMPVKIFKCQRTNDRLEALRLSSDHPHPRRSRTRMSKISGTTADWWAWIDSNYRPHPYQGCALAT